MANSRVKIWKCGSSNEAAAPSDSGAAAGAMGAAAGAVGAAAAGGSSAREAGFVGHAGPVFSTAIRYRTEQGWISFWRCLLAKWFRPSVYWSRD